MTVGYPDLFAVEQEPKFNGCGVELYEATPMSESSLAPAQDSFASSLY